MHVQSSIRKVCSTEVSYCPNPDVLDTHNKLINSFSRLLCVVDLIFISYLFNTEKLHSEMALKWFIYL